MSKQLEAMELVYQFLCDERDDARSRESGKNVKAASSKSLEKNAAILRAAIDAEKDSKSGPPWGDLQRELINAVDDKKALERDLEEKRVLVERLVTMHDIQSKQMAVVMSEKDRLSAIANAGHAEDCAGFNYETRECGCGYLQRQGAHDFINCIEEYTSRFSQLIAERDQLRAVVQTCKQRISKVADHLESMSKNVQLTDSVQLLEYVSELLKVVNAIEQIDKLEKESVE